MSLATEPVRARRRVEARTTDSRLGLRGRPRVQHGVAVISLLGLALWLMRRFVFTSALPAGTDFLGFVNRSSENASLDHILSPWAPSALGAPRQFTLDNLLGLVGLISGDPVASVKLLALATLFAAGVFTYMLAWRWYRNVVVACGAGALYMLSQASLSRWASGQLNVEMATSAAPLVILLWSICLERFSFRRAAALALAMGAVMLVRPDMALYVVPFLGLYLLVCTVYARSPIVPLRSAVATVGTAVPVCVAAVLCQIVPYLGGVRASYLTTGPLFTREDLLDRSLTAYPSLLGFGREIGYLGFSGQQTWFSHPWLPLWAYFLAATALVASGYLALWRWRDRQTVFLLLTAVAATFLAKGVQGPFGSPYEWVTEHVPLFGNLRGPNRWLIFQALAYSLLGALTLQQAGRYVLAASHRFGRYRPAALAGAAAVATTLLLLPVAPTLLSGFRTWRPATGETRLLERVKRDRDPFIVATVPYDQTMRFVSQRGYRGYEHDFGAEGARLTGHPSLGDGGWHRRTADFVSFTSSLLRRSDPAFTELLGSLGVKYLVKFAYPATAPHLTQGDPGGYQQHRAIDAMPGLRRILANRQGNVSRVRSWSPLLSFRPNIAVVLGGRSGLAALADMPGVNLRNWATITAEDALASGGLRGLLGAMDRANLILVSNERLEDVALLAARSLASMPGLTTAPSLDRKTQLVPSDLSTSHGSLEDPSLPPPAKIRSASRTFRLSRKTHGLELWARAQTAPTAGQIALSVDGHVVGRRVPLAVEPGGFRWFRAQVGPLRPGKHRVTLTGSESAFGHSIEVDEVKVLTAASRERTLTKLRAGLAHRQGKLAYALDLDDTQKWSRGVEDQGPDMTLTTEPRHFWHVGAASGVRTTDEHSPTGSRVRVQLERRRSVYSVLGHNFGRPQDWSARGYAFLALRGTGSGIAYRFIVDFNKARTKSATFRFVDRRKGLREPAFSLRSPANRGFDWSHVVSVRLATDSRDTRGSLAVGALSLSRVMRTLVWRYTPFEMRSFAHVSVRSAGDRTAAPSSLVRVDRRGSDLRLRLSLHALGSRYRVTLLPRKRMAELPSRPVRFERRGSTSYHVSLETKRRGMLVFDQGFDPRWGAEFGRRKYRPTPALSAVNGYLLPAGSYSGFVEFDGQPVALIGIASSALALLALLLIAGVLPWDRRDERGLQPMAAIPGGERTTRRAFEDQAGAAMLLAAIVFLVSLLSPLGGVVVALSSISMVGGERRIPLLAAVVLLFVAPIGAALRVADANRLTIDILALILVALVLTAVRERASARAGRP